MVESGCGTNPTREGVKDMADLTGGKECPFSGGGRKCGDWCALYIKDHGCVIMQTVQGLREMNMHIGKIRFQSK
jgi:hypothetical protein